MLGYFASPFSSALIVSFDGGGDDGIFNVFLGQGAEVQRIGNFHAAFSTLYNSFQMLLPDVAGKYFVMLHDHICGQWLKGELKVKDGWYVFNIYHPSVQLDFAGKLMGYSGLRKPGRLTAVEQAELEAFFDPMFSETGMKANNYNHRFPPNLLKLSCTSSDGQKRLAAEIQAQFQKRLYRMISGMLEQLKAARTHVEGIVLTGGCALNVITNQLIRDTLTKEGQKAGTQSHHRTDFRPLGVYVPPAPNDAGLAVGGVWAVQPPRMVQQLQYLGFPLFDEEILFQEVRQRAASNLNDLGGVHYLAQLLTSNSSVMGGKPIIAVVRGRQEFGPRALGHRSLLAVPDSYEIKVPFWEKLLNLFF